MPPLNLHLSQVHAPVLSQCHQVGIFYFINIDIKRPNLVTGLQSVGCFSRCHCQLFFLPKLRFLTLVNRLTRKKGKGGRRIGRHLLGNGWPYFKVLLSQLSFLPSSLLPRRGRRNNRKPVTCFPHALQPRRRGGRERTEGRKAEVRVKK